LFTPNPLTSRPCPLSVLMAIPTVIGMAVALNAAVRLLPYTRQHRFNAVGYVGREGFTSLLKRKNSQGLWKNLFIHSNIFPQITRLRKGGYVYSSWFISLGKNI